MKTFALAVAPMSVPDPVVRMSWAFCPNFGVTVVKGVVVADAGATETVRVTGCALDGLFCWVEKQYRGSQPRPCHVKHCLLGKELLFFKGGQQK